MVIQRVVGVEFSSCSMSNIIISLQQLRVSLYISRYVLLYSTVYTLPFQFPSISVFKDILTCDASNIPASPWLSKLIIQELNTGRYSPQIKVNSPDIFWKYRPWLQTQLNFPACFFLQNLHDPCSRKPQPSNLDPK